MLERSDRLPDHVEFAAIETRFDPHALDLPADCPEDVKAKILERRKKLADATAERIRGSHGK